MTLQVDRYAVFGNPIGQSKSPFIHTLFARQTSQQLTYKALQPEQGEFITAAQAFLVRVVEGVMSQHHLKKMLISSPIA